MNEIGKIIRVLRTKRNWTQLNLALRLGVTPQTVGKWERGESEPDLTLLCSIAEALDVSLDVLFGAESGEKCESKSFSIDAFRSNLKNRRLAADMTQGELGEKLGVCPQTVSKWENGVCAPDIGYCKALCALYGVTATSLFFDRVSLFDDQETQETARQRSKRGRPRLFGGKLRRALVVSLICILSLSSVFAAFTIVKFGASPAASTQQTKPDSDGESDGSGASGSDGSGSGSQQGGEQGSEDKDEEDDGKQEEPSEENPPKEDPPEPEIPPVEEVTVYHSVAIYDDLPIFGEDNLICLDEFVADQTQLFLVTDPASEEGLYYSARNEHYLPEYYTDGDGNPVSFPLTVTEDLELYMVTAPRWVDWLSYPTYEEMQTAEVFAREFESFYVWIESFIYFYDEFLLFQERYPDLPRKELFQRLNGSQMPTLPHTVDAYLGGDETPVTLPWIGFSSELALALTRVEKKDPNLASTARKWVDDKVLVPQAYIGYVFTDEDLPLESAFVTAMSRFKEFVELGHPRVTKMYRDFMRAHENTPRCDLPDAVLNHNYW